MKILNLKNYNIVILLLVIFILSGCGYSFKSMLPSRYKRIYVQMFANKIDITTETTELSRYKTYYPRLEVDLTNEIKNRFNYDGQLRISDKGDADLELSGELINFIRSPLRVTDDSVAEEYRISVVVNMRLKDLKGNNILWEEKNFVGDTTYFLTGSLAKSEASAIEDALKDLSKRIVERTIEDW